LQYVFAAAPKNNLLRGIVIECIGQYFGYFVSILPLMLGFIWVGIDKKKQGFHDKLAGTVVIREWSKEAVKFDK
jgi:uncharacterized RDD family membrane protein YckC